jgi:hypothetical protein
MAKAFNNKPKRISVLDNISYSKYKVLLPYPEKPKLVAKLVARVDSLSDDEILSIPAQRASYALALEKYKEQKEIYSQAIADKNRQFRADLEEEFKLSSHPKAELLWNIAWDKAHGSGLSEVYTEYSILAELLDQDL